MKSAASIYVATCSRVGTETCELGEDFPELQKIDRAARLLEQRLTRAARNLNARTTIESVTELNLMLSDARHDSSFDALLARAETAFADARVVRIRQKPIS